MNTIKLIIADDQVLLRDALQTILNLENDIEVIAVADNGKQAYELVSLHQPVMVLMDVRMPVMDGIQSTRLIKQDFPETKILILSTFAEEDDIIECLAHGACGYLLKDMSGDRLIATIREAINGHFMLPSAIATKLATRLYQMTQMKQSSFDLERMQNLHQITLTDREKEIACLLIKGYNNREIASHLFISEGTVRNYISNLYSKIGTNDRSKIILLLQKLQVDVEGNA